MYVNWAEVPHEIDSKRRQDRRQLLASVYPDISRRGISHLYKRAQMNSMLQDYRIIMMLTPLAYTLLALLSVVLAAPTATSTATAATPSQTIKRAVGYEEDGLARGNDFFCSMRIVGGYCMGGVLDLILTARRGIRAKKSFVSPYYRPVSR